MKLYPFFTSNIADAEIPASRVNLPRDPVKEGLEAGQRFYDTRQDWMTQPYLVSKSSNVIPFPVHRTKAHRP